MGTKSKKSGFIWMVILWVRNLLLVKSLSIKRFAVIPNYQNGQLVSTFSWEVKGCYKIEILGYGDYPGNIAGFSILQKSMEQHITLFFYGNWGKLQQTATVGPSNQYLLDQFSVKLNTPKTEPYPLKISKRQRILIRKNSIVYNTSLHLNEFEVKPIKFTLFVSQPKIILP